MQRCNHFTNWTTRTLESIKNLPERSRTARNHVGTAEIWKSFTAYKVRPLHFILPLVALCSAPCGCFLCHWQNNQSLVGWLICRCCLFYLLLMIVLLFQLRVLFLCPTRLLDVGGYTYWVTVRWFTVKCCDENTSPVDTGRSYGEVFIKYNFTMEN